MLLLAKYQNKFAMR